MNWLQRLFGAADPKGEMKFIGEATVAYAWTVPRTGEKHKSTAHILFFMNENGKRTLKWPKDDHPAGIARDLKSWPTGQACLAWEAGGKFPKDFEPITDTLGPMLVRIVDIQMGLKKDGGDDD